MVGDHEAYLLWFGRHGAGNYIPRTAEDKGKPVRFYLCRMGYRLGAVWRSSMQNGEDLINFLSQELETKEVLRRFPYSLDLRAPMAVAVAILVAQERWTDADDQKYSAGFKKLIFEWAKDLSKLVPDSVADFQALEALRKQGLKAVVDVYKHQFLNRRVRSK